MYCFHASLPDSRPPPVCFSPPAHRTTLTTCPTTDHKTTPTERSSDLSAARWNVHVDDAAVGTLRPVEGNYRIRRYTVPYIAIVLQQLLYPIHLKTFLTSRVKIELERPCFTSLLILMPSSRLYTITLNMKRHVHRRSSS